MPPKLTKEQIEEIVVEYNAGKSIYQIAFPNHLAVFKKARCQISQEMGTPNFKYANNSIN